MGLLTIIANYSITIVKKYLYLTKESASLSDFIKNYAFMSITYYLMQKICMTTYQNVLKKEVLKLCFCNNF